MRLLLLPLTLTLASCAAPSHYMGLNLTSPELPDTVRALAGRAMAGDKQAQLDLGIAFEKGHGVPRDLGKAKKLYRMAATTTGGTIWVYQPPVGDGAGGRVLPVDVGQVRVGLAEASDRLARASTSLLQVEDGE